MKMPTVQQIAIGAAVALGLYLVINKGQGGSAAKNLGFSIGGASADVVLGAVDGVAGGVVQGAGEWVGIPRTDTPDAQAKMRAAMDAGDSLAVSFYAPAATYLKWLWQGRPRYADFQQ